VNNFKIFCMTSDKYLNALRPFAYLFNKYWGESQPVIVCGFSPPDFELPANFTFFSIGKQSDYPVGKWSDALIKVLHHFPKEQILGLMLEDYWICQPVRRDIVTMLVDYVRQFNYVIKADLAADRRFAGGSTPYGTVGDIPLVKSDPQSQYHSSLYPGLWNRELLLSHLRPGESPWDVELKGTPRLAARGDDVVVVGTVTDPWVVNIVLGHRRGNPDETLTDGLSQEDIEYMRNQGWI
jgi:hypothetical protein